MSKVVASLTALIGADTRGFDKGAAGVKTSLVGLAGKFITTTAVVTGLTEAFRFSIAQASEAQNVNAKLAAVIESTGGAAGMTADQLDGLAVSLSKVSTYDDEAIKSSEALLLTFTNIGGQAIPQATQAILDMSAALGQDLQASTMQLGKALNDPIAGLNALRRVGVQFTDDQKKMIEALVESGDTLGAQKIILAELNKEFGGQAAAAAKTYTGQISQLKNEFGNLGEAVGQDLLPDLIEFVKTAKVAVEWTTQNYTALKKWGNTILWITNPFLQLSKIAGKALRGVVIEEEELTEVNNELRQSSEGVSGAFEEQDAAMLATEESTKRAQDAIDELSDAYKDYLSNVFDVQGGINSDNEKELDLKRQLTDAQQNLTNAVHEYGSNSEQALDAAADVDEVIAAQGELAAEMEKNHQQRIYDLMLEKVMQDGVMDAADKKALESYALRTGLITEEALAREKLDNAIATGILSNEGIETEGIEDRIQAVKDTQRAAEDAATAEVLAMQRVTQATQAEIQAQGVLQGAVGNTAGAYENMAGVVQYSSPIGPNMVGGGLPSMSLLSGASGGSSFGGFSGYGGLSPDDRDSGGAGIAGTPYMIGTGAQPEMFVPSTNGTFIPNADKKMSGSTYNIVINNPKAQAAEIDIRKALKSASYTGSFA